MNHQTIRSVCAVAALVALLAWIVIPLADSVILGTAWTTISRSMGRRPGPSSLLQFWLRDSHTEDL